MLYFKYLAAFYSEANYVNFKCIIILFFDRLLLVPLLKCLFVLLHGFFFPILLRHYHQTWAVIAHGAGQAAKMGWSAKEREMA